MRIGELDLINFERSIACLQEGITAYQSNTKNTLVRDGLMQRFEFTYELSHKTLKRYLESASATPEQYDRMTFQDLIRSGSEQNLLLGEWLDWKRYREMRIDSSHAYDDEVALKVVMKIPEFLQEVTYLLNQLRERLR